MTFTVRALTVKNWPDLAQVLGPSGGDRGCWCQWWSCAPKQYDAMTPHARRDALNAEVTRGEVVGIVGYLKSMPVGWCAVAPADRSLPRRQRSRAWKPVDEVDVWSVTCFYIVSDHRGAGLAQKLLAGAEEFARSRGARWLEAYPRDCMGVQLPARAMYFGSVGMFLDAGFTEVARRVPEFPVVRKSLRPGT